MTTLLCGIGLTLCAAGDTAENVAKKPTPFTKANGAWISVSGKVINATPDGFTLDYGKGAVLVEMDDWDWYKEGYAILEGDRVSVDGRIDRDEGEKTSIEASSVYVKSLQTFFYASAEDEEDFPNLVVVSEDPNTIVHQGTVTKIDGREFVLTDEYGSVVIDTKTLSYNPMDNKGYQQIRVGDVVRVYGQLDKGIFEADEIHPSAIITLRKF